ncbi:MAG: iron-containing alcohol dehydrogenase [Clostridia bacterium]|jgi:glycerol-1-phosphate dehydrogenase [NAD(P)+]|nr:iron-containing alcohol dehydrogenase [Clostridia bacterium]
MHLNIIRENGQLKLENLHCGCAYDHDMPDMKIFIYSGLLGDCANLVKQNMTGSNVLVVCDEITHEVAAKQIIDNLQSQGYNCTLCMFAGEPVEPSPEREAQVAAMIESDTDFLLSVGSGVVTDVTRHAAFMAEKPFAVFGTAASMDGYTSITSSMMENGMKITKYGKSADILMFDPTVLATAPPIMQAAGIGDVLAKYNVLVDWKLGSIVSDETFCPLCEELLLAALDLCSSNVDEIIARSEKGMEALIESLILAGLTVLIVRYTRPVASVEHNMSHYWEMSALAYGGSSPSHGVGVGIGLIYSLIFHDILRSANMADIDKEKIKASRMTKAQKKEFIMTYYPPGVGKEVLQVNHFWYLTWEQQQARIDALIAYHERYKQDCAILPSYQSIIDMFEKMDAPTSAKKAGIDKDRLRKTLLCTKDFRPRYSIANAIDELGLLGYATQKVLDMEDSL